MFISDGEGMISDTKAREWQAYKAQHGCRLLYVPVDPDVHDQYSRYNLPEHCDKVIPLAGEGLFDDEKLASDLASKVARWW